MSLYTVSSGQVINAADVNQLVNVLQAGAGVQEVGGYYLNGWGNAANDQIGAWVPSRSRGSTPVSVSTDTSVQAATNCGSVSTNALTSNGFHASTLTTGASTACYVGGQYTIQY